jgi:hypothetical protein
VDDIEGDALPIADGLCVGRPLADDGVGVSVGDTLGRLLKPLSGDSVGLRVGDADAPLLG